MRRLFVKMTERVSVDVPRKSIVRPNGRNRSTNDNGTDENLKNHDDSDLPQCILPHVRHIHGFLRARHSVEHMLLQWESNHMARSCSLYRPSHVHWEMLASFNLSTSNFTASSTCGHSMF